MNPNLYAQFAQARPAAAEAPLLRPPGGELHTYAAADRESARLARFLADRGVAPGDRISAQVEKSPAALWLYLACLRGGYVFHPLNPAYTPAELAYLLQDAAPAAFIHDPALGAALAPLAGNLRIARRYTLDAAGQGSLMDASRHTPPQFGVVASRPDEPAALLYSSGTTGQPKGIPLSHRNLAANARALTDAWGFTAADVLLHALPIFHVHGLFVATGCVLMSGASMIFLPKFDPDAVLAALPRATVMMGVPTHYTRLLAVPAFGRDLTAGLRLFTCGSAPLLPETFREFEIRTGQRILERYGMTETNIITSNPLAGERRAGSVGLPLPGVALRIVSPNGTAAGVGQIGHVQVRGESVFSAYWRRPDKTAEDFTADGYFNTGDDGVIGGDGYLTLVGRAKDLIITGGLNVYPKEVEAVLDTLPGVIESAVIGLPHPDFGEQVVAVLVLAQDTGLDEAAIRETLKRRLAAYKLPKRCFAVAVLPRNAMGKVQKTRLREEFLNQV